MRDDEMIDIDVYGKVDLQPDWAEKERLNDEEELLRSEEAEPAQEHRVRCRALRPIIFDNVTTLRDNSEYLVKLSSPEAVYHHIGI